MDQFLLEFSIRALLVAAGTALVLRAARVRTASMRHAAWTGVLVVMLLLPLWTAWGARVRLKVLPAAKTVVSVPPAAAPLTEQRALPAATTTSVLPSRPESRSWSAQGVLIAVYVVVAGFLLLRLALGTLRAQLLIRRATPCDGLLTSASCASPLTVGWFRPVAILPTSWRDWPQAQLDAVLTHEREHARRRDPLVQWLALLNRAVFWFHPLSWWLERQLSVLAEEACDAAVLAKGHSAQDYSEYLLRMADSVMRAGRRVRLVGMAMPGSFLPRRIPRLFDADIARGVSRSRSICAIVACAISSVVFSALVLEAREIHAAALTVPPSVAAVSRPEPAPPQPQPVSAAEAPAAVRPQTPAAPVQIEVDARLLSANKSFTRELPSQAGFKVGMRNTNSDANGVSSDSGLFFLTQPGGDVLLDQIITAAEASGTAKLISRPKVTTPSDTMAEVSQGTQIPVQATMNGATTVQFLTAAFKLEITPTVADAGMISMKVSVESQQPDFGAAINGVPQQTIQRSTTEFLMKEGSTVLISGISATMRPLDMRQVPGLGRIPIIGNLFRNGQATSDSDILLLLTPRIKTP